MEAAAGNLKAAGATVACLSTSFKRSTPVECVAEARSCYGLRAVYVVRKVVVFVQGGKGCFGCSQANIGEEHSGQEMSIDSRNCQLQEEVRKLLQDLLTIGSNGIGAAWCVIETGAESCSLQFEVGWCVGIAMHWCSATWEMNVHVA